MQALLTVMGVIDRAMLSESVDYEPKFDPNDAMQNVLDDFLASRK